MTRKNIISLTLILLIGVVVQAWLLALDCKETPADAATAFARAYYGLCPSLADRLCTRIEDPVEAAQRHIHTTTANIIRRGYDKHFARYALFDVETRTEYLDDTTAVVHISAHRRINLNPVFTWVAAMFRLGDTRTVEKQVSMVLEDGRWKACTDLKRF